MPHERAELDRFLGAHPSVTMFLRSNLASAGLVDGPSRFQGAYAAAWREGEIRAVAAHYWNDNVVLHAPVALAEVVRAAVRARGRPVAGILGPYDQVLAATEALGLGRAPLRLDSRQILYTLDLDALQTPDCGGLRARLARPDDAPVLAPWRREYDRTLGVDDEGAASDDELQARVAHTLDAGDTWLLERNGTPVATTAFNARLPDCVQVGGVFTPAPERAQGYARCVVAASLAYERSRGVERAILFTGEDNLSARRSYEALGFREIGNYGIRLFRTAGPG